MSAADDTRTVRIVVHGKVQGVGFRNWVSRLAAQLDLSGWVRNRGDGTVEALFSGTATDVDEAIARCRKGPRSAQCTALHVEPAQPADDEPAHRFEVRPSLE
jgi:acylphosphatase